MAPIAAILAARLAARLAAILAARLSSLGLTHYKILWYYVMNYANKINLKIHQLVHAFLQSVKREAEHDACGNEPSQIGIPVGIEQG